MNLDRQVFLVFPKRIELSRPFSDPQGLSLSWLPVTAREHNYYLSTLSQNRTDNAFALEPKSSDLPFLYKGIIPLILFIYFELYLQVINSLNFQIER